MPSAAAQALRQQRSKIIGVIVKDILDPSSLMVDITALCELVGIHVSGQVTDKGFERLTQMSMGSNALPGAHTSRLLSAVRRAAAPSQPSSVAADAAQPDQRRTSTASTGPRAAKRG
jgi:hypothetical protein